MFGWHYNSSIRRYIVLLGNLFSGVQIKRVRSDGERFIKVPITYAKKEKFMMSLDKYNNISSEEDVAKVETILPRMCLSLIDMTYAQNFKTNITNKTVPKYTADGIRSVTQYNPVPYKFTFELGIYTRNEDDMFQIIEQILPYFQPHFNCKIKELHGNDVWIDRDIQVTISSITPDEQVGEDKFSRRRLEWTIMFEFIGFIYPPATDVKGEIRTIYLDFHANSRELNPSGNFESVDHEVVKRDVEQEDWDGTIKESYSSDIPIPVAPTPPGPRSVREF